MRRDQKLLHFETATQHDARNKKLSIPALQYQNVLTSGREATKSKRYELGLRWG